MAYSDFSNEYRSKRMHPRPPHKSPCPQNYTSKTHCLYQPNYAKSIEWAKENLLVTNLNFLKIQRYLILAHICGLGWVWFFFFP